MSRRRRWMSGLGAAFGVGGARPLLDNLISFWELGEASGTRVDSVVTSGNDLTDNNTVTQAVGKVGNAAQFTAANSEYLSRADNASLSVGDIDFTLAGWAYFDTLPSQRTVVAKWREADNNRAYRLWRDDAANQFSFSVSSTGANIIKVTATTFGDLATATWYFVVAWHDATANTINIQVNNGTADTVSHTLGVFDDGALFALGAVNDGGAAFQDGRIDQVGFWKRILTASEKTFLYNNGDGRSFSEL